MDVGKVAAPDGMIDDSRREALKRFARYAAAAPATMVLLHQARVPAGPKKPKNPRSQGAAGTTNLGNSRALSETRSRSLRDRFL